MGYNGSNNSVMANGKIMTILISNQVNDFGLKIGQVRDESSRNEVTELMRSHKLGQVMTLLL